MTSPGDRTCVAEADCPHNNCPVGYTYDYTTEQCIDDDECLTNPCHAHANCTNIPGSYNCTCMDGFEGLVTKIHKYILYYQN